MIQEKLGSLQIRHLVQVVVCALAIYLLRVRKTYQLVPAWRKDLDPSLYRNGQFPTQDEKLPHPIVTDLNGDGSEEVVIISNDLQIEVARVISSDQSGVKLPHTRILFSRLLPTGQNVSDIAPGRPVVIETGYLDQYQSQDQSRHQVILVLLSNWFLICYDHELNLLWQQLVMDTGRLLEDHRPHAMAILVTPHTLQKGDRGLVIVGGSFTHKGHNLRDEPLQEEEPMNKPVDVNANEDTFTRFSTFAFSGANGTSRWFHLPGSTNYMERAPGEDAHHWKLSLRRGHWPHGKVHWSRFGTYLLQHTPHHWHHLKDTTFDLANIRKLDQDDTHTPTVDPSLLVDLDLNTEHLIGKPYGGMRPHSRHEHLSNPNAVVVHNHLGLEVLSVDSGQLITDLRLDNPNAVYADINHDGKLDQVRVSFSGGCHGEASTIHPRPKAMFAGDVCKPATWWSQQVDDISEDTHLQVAPIVIKSVAKPLGLLNHLLGKALPSERKGYDSIFLTSTGTLTSFNHHGHVNWKANIPTQWSDKARAANYYHFRNTAEGAIYYQAFTPSMMPFSLQLYGPQSSSVICGWDNVAVVDLQDGFVQAQHTLPCQTLQPPVIADFNEDGWNDLIVICANGYIGLSLHRQPQYFYMTILSVTVVLSMLLLSWCCQLDHSDEND